jgi:hypothetical protein
MYILYLWLPCHTKYEQGSNNTRQSGSVYCIYTVQVDNSKKTQGSQAVYCICIYMPIQKTWPSMAANSTSDLYILTSIVVMADQKIPKLLSKHYFFRMDRQVRSLRHQAVE